MVPMTRNLFFRPQTFPFLARNLKFSTRQSAIPLTGIKRPSLKRRDFKQEYQGRMTSDYSESLHEKAIAALARLRSGMRPPQTPSKRTPERESTHNCADCLENALNETGFQSWGFAIYRCTYQSNSDWEEFLRRYRWHIADALEYNNGLDLLESFKMTVFENEALFGGVGVSTSTATIREHFQQWATTAMQEQGVSPDMLAIANFEAARYRLCLFVDEESLQSVIQPPLEDRFNKNAFVNMLNGWWKEESLDDHDPEDLDDDELEAVRQELLNGYDPIEGCTVQDVGWMKVTFRAAGLAGFLRLGELGEWERYYVRPSEICDYI